MQIRCRLLSRLFFAVTLLRLFLSLYMDMEQIELWFEGDVSKGLARLFQESTVTKKQDETLATPLWGLGDILDRCLYLHRPCVSTYFWRCTISRNTPALLNNLLLNHHCWRLTGCSHRAVFTPRLALESYKRHIRSTWRLLHYTLGWVWSCDW